MMYLHTSLLAWSSGYFYLYWNAFLLVELLQITLTMVKAVAVLGSSEGVKGTIYFTQEGDGKPLHILWPILFTWIAVLALLMLNGSIYC